MVQCRNAGVRRVVPSGCAALQEHTPCPLPAHAPPPPSLPPQGIANTELLGISGPTWRGLDILMAQALLARTLGHALGARSGAVQALANLVFPAVLLGYTHLLADGVLTLGFASKVLVAVLLATLGAKAALEGFDTLVSERPA